jgi:hypothetical protein
VVVDAARSSKARDGVEECCRSEEVWRDAVSKPRSAHHHHQLVLLLGVLMDKPGHAADTCVQPFLNCVWVQLHVEQLSAGGY